MNFVGNVPKRGHLYPGTDTPNDCPIGFVKTCQTGNFEFMYFKDYEVIPGTSEKSVIIFKSFEEEFLSGIRQSDTEYRFHAAFLRIPKEFQYTAIEKIDNTTTGKTIFEKIPIDYYKGNIVFSGLALFNINSRDEDSACSNSYFNLTHHLKTDIDGPQTDHIDSYNSEEKRKENLKKFMEQFYPEIPESFRTNAPGTGCEIPSYVGKNKPLLFKFNQKHIVAKTSYMFLTIGTDNVVVFAEATDNMYINKYIDKLQDPVDEVEDSNGNKKKLIAGIKNMHPAVYGPYRFDENYGVHFLLSVKDGDDSRGGWDIGYWNLVEYFG